MTTWIRAQEAAARREAERAALAAELAARPPPPQPSPGDVAAAASHAAHLAASQVRRPHRCGGRARRPVHRRSLPAVRSAYLVDSLRNAQVLCATSVFRPLSAVGAACPSDDSRYGLRTAQGVATKRLPVSVMPREISGPWAFLTLNRSQLLRKWSDS